jgi:plasmid stabilization system protein ParE
MKRKLVMRPQAELDLLRHCVFLTDRQPRSGEKFKQAVRAAIASAKSRPRSGAALALESHPDIELRFVKPRGFRQYLIIYQVTDDSISILRILHGLQDIESALRQ